MGTIKYYEKMTCKALKWYAVLASFSVMGKLQRADAAGLDIGNTESAGSAENVPPHTESVTDASPALSSEDGPWFRVKSRLQCVRCCRRRRSGDISGNHLQKPLLGEAG